MVNARLEFLIKSTWEAHGGGVEGAQSNTDSKELQKKLPGSFQAEEAS